MRASIGILLACSTVGIVGCSGDDAHRTGPADAATPSSHDASEVRDGATSAPRDASDDVGDAQAPMDGGVMLRAVDQLVRQRIVVNDNVVCALNQARDIVCWGAKVGQNAREDHTPLKGPFLTLDVQSGSGIDNAVCGLHPDAGLECAAWDESASTFLDVDRCTQSDHDVSFVIDRAARSTVVLIDDDGGIVHLNDDCKRTMPIPATGRRMVQVEEESGYVCGRDETGVLACAMPPGDGGLDVVQPTPADTYRDVAVNEFGACALTTAGKVRCWDLLKGEDTSAKGFAALVSQRSSAVLQLVTRTGYEDSVCALNAAGHVFCGDFTGPFVNQEAVDAGGAVAELAAGQEAVCLVHSDDSVRCVPWEGSCTDGCDALRAKYAAPEGLVLAPR